MRMNRDSAADFVDTDPPGAEQRHFHLPGGGDRDAAGRRGIERHLFELGRRGTRSPAQSRKGDGNRARRGIIRHPGGGKTRDSDGNPGHRGAGKAQA